MGLGGIILLSWIVTCPSLTCHDTRRYAVELPEEDRLRRRTMQSFIGLLGISTTTKKERVVSDPFSIPNPSPSLFTRKNNHPLSYEYKLQSPKQSTLTRSSEQPDHVQWTCHDWQLDVTVQSLPPTYVSWNDLVQHRLLQVQDEYNCVVTCREEPWRLSSQVVELCYTTRHRPWTTEHRQEWKTRIFWNDHAVLSAHCHGRVLPEKAVQTVLNSIVFQ